MKLRQIVDLFWLIMLVIGIVILIRGCYISIDSTETCIENGYTEARRITSGTYCIGVRDGDTVTIPIDELDVR